MEQSSKPTSKFYGLFQYVFDHYNDALFCGTIKDCLIVVTRRKNVFGHNTRKRWFSIQDQETDELALNPSMFIKFPSRNAPWMAVPLWETLARGLPQQGMGEQNDRYRIDAEQNRKARGKK